MPLTPSTRWCPTPEQLMILEEMYRSGVRTPNATQIQQITAHLSCYGKIEGKNVFYWFQNHKARDRQKLRRQLNGNHQPHEAAPPPRPLTHHHSPPHFLEGGLQEDIQGMDLLGKLDSGGSEDEERATSSITLGFEWMTTMDFSSVPPAFCRPLQTLDLFPAKNSRDECSSSKSSSCSTSTN